MNKRYCFEPIGVVHSVFTEKFGIPRQPGLVPAARGCIELYPDYASPEAFRGLDEVSHIWLSFVFHANKTPEWTPTVRPPRLGGNTRIGVYASRSPYRPNPLGQSVLRLESVDAAAGRIEVSGLDLLDGTPVLDIKPYLPYADVVANARAVWAPAAPVRLPVRFSDAAQAALTSDGDLLLLVEQVLSLDPRPAYQQELAGREYGLSLAGLNLRWRVDVDGVLVLSAEPRR